MVARITVCQGYLICIQARGLLYCVGDHLAFIFPQLSERLLRQRHIELEFGCSGRSRPRLLLDYPSFGDTPGSDPESPHKPGKV